MSTFEYLAVTVNNEEFSGEIEADCKADAVNKIKNKGLYPKQVIETGKQKIKPLKNSRNEILIKSRTQKKLKKRKIFFIVSIIIIVCFFGFKTFKGRNINTLIGGYKKSRSLSFNNFWEEIKRPYTGRVYGNFRVSHTRTGKIKGFFKNGRKEGTWTRWHPNGQKESQVNYKNGKPFGLGMFWHENGQIAEKKNWKDGKVNGLWQEWYEGGQKRKENTYKDGKRDGLALQWHENGQKISETDYNDGKKVEGSANFWNSDGESVDSYENRRRTYRIRGRSPKPIQEKVYHSDSLAENILGKRISIQYTVPAIGIRDIIALQFEKDKSIIIAVKKDSKLSPDGGNYSYEVVDKEVQIISSNDKNLEAKFSSVTPMIGDKIIMNLGGEDLFEGKITRVEKAKKFDVDVKLLAVTTFDKDSVNLQDLTEKDGIFYDPKSSEPFSGKAFTLDPIIGQRKSSEGKILNGKTEGLWIHWHMNGEKLGEQNYKDGKLHGKQRSWFDSSSGDRWMSDEVTYNNGKEVEGSHKFFNRKGQQVKSMTEALR